MSRKGVGAMDRLIQMDELRFVEALLPECRRVLLEVARAVNAAPDGQVISGSEMQVRDLMVRLRESVFQTALQQKIDSTESNFSPSEGLIGPANVEQRAGSSKHPDGQRPGDVASAAVLQQ